jgi:hypothetical protein
MEPREHCHQEIESGLLEEGIRQHVVGVVPVDESVPQCGKVDSDGDKGDQTREPVELAR